MNELRSQFELWAASYWAIPLDKTYMPEHDAYVDETLQSAWSAYKSAHNAALNSLCLGVDCLDGGGATISLLSRVGEITTVLACGHTEDGHSNAFRVVI